MNTTIQCIVLLACIIMCTSMAILDCQCAKTSKTVKPSLIADVKEYKPRPYCNKEEVIVVLKDKQLKCLDPKGNFTQAVLRTIHMQKAARAFKMNIPSGKTTTDSTTAPATVPPTSS